MSYEKPQQRNSINKLWVVHEVVVVSVVGLEVVGQDRMAVMLARYSAHNAYVRSGYQLYPLFTVTSGKLAPIKGTSSQHEIFIPKTSFCSIYD